MVRASEERLARRTLREAGKICAQNFLCGRRTFNKSHVRGTSADGLNTHGARPGIEIQKNGAPDARGQNVEKRLAQPIARGPGGKAGGRLKRARAKCSGDDAHW